MTDTTLAAVLKYLHWRVSDLEADFRMDYRVQQARIREVKYIIKDLEDAGNLAKVR